MSNQRHNYNADLSYHFCNLALAAEVQPLWETAENDADNLEDLFAIPRKYYDEIFIASHHSGQAMYDDIHGYIQEHYEQIGHIRLGENVLPDYQEIEESLSNVEEEIGRIEGIFRVMQSYSRRLTEAMSDTIRYSFSQLLIAYVLRSKVDGHGVIVMRGTISTQEWLNNLNYQQTKFHSVDDTYGMIHSGFRDIYKGIRANYRAYINEFDEDADIYLVGHSLGAALSQIGALDIAVKYPERADKLQVYAYAPPRVGNQTFVEQYNRLVPTSYRIVNICDLVPYIPFTELGDFIGMDSYPYADTKGELMYTHQAGNPIANHLSAYHIATRDKLPQSNESHDE